VVRPERLDQLERVEVPVRLVQLDCLVRQVLPDCQVVLEVRGHLETLVRLELPVSLVRLDPMAFLALTDRLGLEGNKELRDRPEVRESRAKLDLLAQLDCLARPAQPVPLGRSGQSVNQELRA